MIRWLAGGLAVALAGSAWAADPCKTALKELARAPVVTLAVESERLTFTHVSFGPDAASDKDTWRQFNRFTGDAGASWEGVDELTCEDGVLYLHNFTHRTPVGDVEDFHPPLPWQKLVLVEGDAWEWTGVLTVGPPGSDLRLVADAQFEVGTPLQLDVPTGSHAVVPVTYTLHVGGTRVVTTSWITPDSPWTLIQRVRTFYDADGTPARTDRWTLERISLR